MTTLYEIYTQIYVNEVYCDVGRTEDKLLLLKEVVRIFSTIEQSDSKFEQMKKILNKMNSWKKLKSKIM